MADVKEKARDFLRWKWKNICEAEEYDCETEYVRRLKNDFYAAVELYEAMYDEEVCGSTFRGVLFEAKGEEFDPYDPFDDGE